MGRDLSGNIERLRFKGYAYAATGLVALVGTVALGIYIILKR